MAGDGHQGQDQPEQAPAEPRGRVRFGDGPTHTMPLEWAETMFRNWRQADPEGFGFAMAEAAMGVAPARPPARRRAAAER